MPHPRAAPARRPRLLCVGLATLDVVQRVERVPAADEKVVARDLWVSAGGPAANAAVTAAALGIEARLLTRVGEGAVAGLVLTDLREHDVEVVDLAGPGASPAVSTVLVTDGTGERAVVSVNATRSAVGSAELGTADDLLVGGDAVLVDGHHLDLATPIARRAHARGTPVLLDGGSWKPGLEELLPYVDVALLSEAFRLPDDASPDSTLPDSDAHLLHRVRALGARVVARSQGSGPVRLLDGDRMREVPVERVEVHDTLGAGDVLHGALGAWLAVQGPRDVRAGLGLAARVASASCSAAGARGWLADTETVRRYTDDLMAP